MNSDVKKRICWTLLDLIEGLPRTERRIGEGQVGFLKALGSGKLLSTGNQGLSGIADWDAMAEGDRQLRDSFREARRLVWDLWLVYDHLCKLSGIGWQGDIVDAGRLFKKLYESEHLKCLADALDHAAERLAAGHDNEFKVHGGGEGNVQSIKVFSKQYRVRGTIDAALKLMEPLRTFMASI